MPLFETEGDYAAFERTLFEALIEHPMRILAYCLMPTHWHLVLWPKKDGQLTDFMRWATHTHVMRWHAYHETVGTGPLYQGRFKAFGVQDDAHFLAVCRYVERNGLRANLVGRAEVWRWCSLWRRLHPGVVDDVPALSEWPVRRPRNWVQRVNQPESQQELTALRHCVRKSAPFGSEQWVARACDRLHLTHTLRSRGRPPNRSGRSAR